MFCFGFYFIFLNLIRFYVANMEQATTSRKGEKLRSYTIIFTLKVVEFAEKKSILAAALNYKPDRHSIRFWKIKNNETKKENIYKVVAEKH